MPEPLVQVWNVIFNVITSCGQLGLGRSLGILDGDHSWLHDCRGNLQRHHGSACGKTAARNGKCIRILFIKKKESSTRPFLYVRKQMHGSPINTTTKMLFHDHIGQMVAIAVNMVMPKNEVAMGIARGWDFFHSVTMMYSEFLLLNSRQSCKYKKVPK